MWEQTDIPAYPRPSSLVGGAAWALIRGASEAHPTPIRGASDAPTSPPWGVGTPLSCENLTQIDFAVEIDPPKISSLRKSHEIGNLAEVRRYKEKYGGK